MFCSHCQDTICIAAAHEKADMSGHVSDMHGIQMTQTQPREKGQQRVMHVHIDRVVTVNAVDTDTDDISSIIRGFTGISL